MENPEEPHMSILTEKMVRKAADEYQSLYYAGASHYESTRAALTAILPDIVEVCAKVAELHADRTNGDYTIANSIRALAEKDKP